MSINTTIPNLFLVGAPKCGTTSMAYYLSQHKSIFVSDYKEPHYFATNYGGRDVSVIDDYLGLFHQANQNHRWLVDASVLYMYFGYSIKNIIDFNPDAHFITMVRDPLTMVPSWFAQMQLSRHGREEAKTLEDAWLLIQDRRSGKNIPNGCTDTRILYYDHIAKYAEQLINIFNYVSRDKVHVIVFDDMKNNPRKSFDELCDFLNICRQDDIDFGTLNTRSMWRSEIFSRIFRSRFRPLARKALKIMGLQATSAPIRRILFKSVAPTQISRRTADFIGTCYRQDVRMLEQLLGRSLRGWLGGTP